MSARAKRLAILAVRILLGTGLLAYTAWAAYPELRAGTAPTAHLFWHGGFAVLGLAILPAVLGWAADNLKRLGAAVAPYVPLLRKPPEGGAG